MASRLELHDDLEEILGNKNVYFQPPNSLKMNYPCIRYRMAKADVDFADDTIYNLSKRYEITLIHRDPDNDIWEKILQMPNTINTTNYVADGLNHYVFIHYR